MTQVVEIPLSEVLKPIQLEHVKRLVTDGDADSLRVYLQAIEPDLNQHGLEVGYLYYWLCWKFKLL